LQKVKNCTTKDRQKNKEIGIEKNQEFLENQVNENFSLWIKSSL